MTHPEAEARRWTILICHECGVQTIAESSARVYHSPLCRNQGGERITVIPEAQHREIVEKLRGERDKLQEALDDLDAYYRAQYAAGAQEAEREAQRFRFFIEGPEVEEAIARQATVTTRSQIRFVLGRAVAAFEAGDDPCPHNCKDGVITASDLGDEGTSSYCPIHGPEAGDEDSGKDEG